MFLGIDIGTQSVKVLIYNADTRSTVAASSAPLAMDSHPDGTREQLASWWLEALEHCLGDLPKPLRAGVQAIGVSGQQHGFVALDKNDAVLAPVKLWCDTATVAECAQITAAFGGRERCISEVGNAILPGYTAPKILWLKNHRPAEYARLRTVFLPHDYINWFLTGERGMEFGDASGTGLLDIRQRQWHQGMLQALDAERDLSATMPTLVHSASAPMGQLRAELAAQWGLAPNIPVASGGGDNMMAAIGTGNVSAGCMTVSLGTSGTMFASSDRPIIDPSGNIAAFCSSTGGWLPLLCTMNCTVATELTRRLLGVGLEDFEQAVSAVPAGAGGVITLPFFNGERAPDLPHGKGCILGLDDSNYTSDNLLRSAMESALYALRAGLDAFVRHGIAVDEIRLTGGGARSAVWRQMAADIFNVPVVVPAVDEGAALGAALQALWMVRSEQGQGSSLQSLLDTQLLLDGNRACEPEADVAASYDQYYRDYLRHVETVTALYA